jgi:hypothetical protein
MKLTTVSNSRLGAHALEKRETLGLQSHKKEWEELETPNSPHSMMHTLSHLLGHGDDRETYENQTDPHE